eukprot:226226-Lingulodinium_polyedra.AAC.1
MLWAPVSIPWDDQVLVHDASRVGYGVCARKLPTEQVSGLGRVAEAWRYAVPGAERARHHALGCL